MLYCWWSDAGPHKCWTFPPSSESESHSMPLAGYKWLRLSWSPFLVLQVAEMPSSCRFLFLFFFFSFFLFETGFLFPVLAVLKLSEICLPLFPSVGMRGVHHHTWLWLLLLFVSHLPGSYWWTPMSPFVVVINTTAAHITVSTPGHMCAVAAGVL